MSAARDAACCADKQQIQMLPSININSLSEETIYYVTGNYGIKKKKLAEPSDDDKIW